MGNQTNGWVGETVDLYRKTTWVQSFRAGADDRQQAGAAGDQAAKRLANELDLVEFKNVSFKQKYIAKI